MSKKFRGGRREIIRRQFVGMISFFRCKKYLGIDVANVDLFLRAFLCYAYVEFWLLKSASFLEVPLSSVKPAGVRGSRAGCIGAGFFPFQAFLVRACQLVTAGALNTAAQLPAR